MEKRRVCVIGAGVSGLVTAKAFLANGHSVTVLEQVATVGGVWAPSRRYPGIQLQVPCECYAFSDYPMPSHYPQYPDGQQIYEYLEAYSKHFGVFEHIRFGTEVVRICRPTDGGSGWQIHIRRDGEMIPPERAFDFVVVCNGIFSIPEIPELPGRDEFEGNGGVVLHSSQLGDTTQLDGRSVVVVGFGKSAVDIAQSSLSSARSCTLLCRRILWKLPRRVWGRINIKYLILTRFADVWFPHPDMGGWKRFLHTRLKLVVDVYWWLAERIVARQLGLNGPRLSPAGRLREEPVGLGLAPPDDFQALRQGRIKLHRGTLKRLTARGVELDDGGTIEAQTVVLGTGYRQLFRFLDDHERALLIDKSGATHLYRLLINPDIPHMAFNGYNGVFACQLAAEIGATWIVQFVAGRITMPDHASMRMSIAREIDARRRLLSTEISAGSTATPFSFTYFDQLLADLGHGPADRQKGLLRRTFTPIDPSDYRDLLSPSACREAV
jgi:dimethylaniline monooxygenase (N-oxide forming)